MPNFVETSIVTAIDAIKEGWTLVKGTKFRFFILAFLQSIFLGILCVTYMLIVFLPQFESVRIGAEEFSDFHPTMTTVPGFMLFWLILIYVICNCFIYFLTAMLEMLAIRKAIGAPSTISIVFRECRKVVIKITLLSLLLTFLILLTYALDDLRTGFSIIKILAHVGELYVTTALTLFSLPLLIINPNINFFSAIKDGIQKMNSKWLSIAFLFASAMLMTVIGILTLFIAFLWFIPLIYLSCGVIFREAYQLKSIEDFT